MQSTEYADFTYHAFIVVGVVFATWLLIALLVKTGLIRILMLVRYMRVVGNGVLALWGGVIGANIVVLASALPYIYYTQDPSMRCGSLGIANLAINMIPTAMLAIIPLALFFYVGRACISATIRPHGPIVGFIVRDGAIIGGFLWITAAVTGLTALAWFLESLTILVPSPPRLPPNMSDKACSEFIGMAQKPATFDPFGVWFRILR